MYITYFKDTGEITPPIMTCDRVVTLEDVYGEEKAKIYSKIYSYINIKDDMYVMNNIKNYYVDLETKELKEKPIKLEVKTIEYL